MSFYRENALDVALNLSKIVQDFLIYVKRAYKTTFLF